MELPPEESHHASRVVRVRKGDKIGLLDGKGLEATAELRDLSKNKVFVLIKDLVFHSKPAEHVVLGMARLHSRRILEDVVEKCTEIGIGGFAFFRGTRSQGSPQIPDKWRRIVVETCKQCGRFWLPEFFSYSSLLDLLQVTPKPVLVAVKADFANGFGGVFDSETTSATIIVGPEGDFSTEELDQLRSFGSRFIYLNANITYRSETAAFLMSSLVLYEMGKYKKQNN